PAAGGDAADRAVAVVGDVEAAVEAEGQARWAAEAGGVGGHRRPARGDPADRIGTGIGDEQGGLGGRGRRGQGRGGEGQREGGGLHRSPPYVTGRTPRGDTLIVLSLVRWETPPPGMRPRRRR